MHAPDYRLTSTYRVALVVALLALPLMAGWERVVYENFEGAFPAAGWTTFSNGLGSGSHWGVTGQRSSEGWYSAWCGASGSPALSPGSGYAPNMHAWMIYGPFSLADATHATLSFRYWNDSEAGYDYLRWMVSIDGTHFYGAQTSGYSGGWRNGELDLTAVATLGDVTGRDRVWIAFVFQSDSSVQYEGAYIDQIEVRKLVPDARPRLISAESGISPAATVPGMRLAATYRIYNPGPWSSSIGLGLRLHEAAGPRVLTDSWNARSVVVPVGYSTHLRYFDVPPDASGYYDVFWTLHEGTTGGALIDGVGKERYVHVNTPPRVTPADILDAPAWQTLHPTRTYSIRARYRDADGPDDLRQVWLRLRQNGSLAWPSITFFLDTQSGARGEWPGNAGANWARLLDVAVRRLHDGYEVRWTFRLLWAWPGAGRVDVGIAAEDVAGLMTSWAYDNTNASFERDLRVESSSLSAPSIEVGQAIHVSGRVGFAGSSQRPDLWQGLGVELRHGSPSGPLLSATALSSSHFQLAWQAPLHAVGTHELYITVSSAWHASPRTSDYWWDRHQLTVLPDATAPAAPLPIVSTHPSPDAWYPHASPSVTWAAPSDISGIAGYSISIDRQSATVPAAVISTTSRSATFAGLEDGIWYVHLRAMDGAGNWSATAHRPIRIDTTGPTGGGLRIAGGAAVTESLIVTLDQLVATDALSGVNALRLSNNGTTWTPPQAWLTNRPWDLSLAGGTTLPGEKTVYVQYRDWAGNWSSPVSADITYAPPPQSHSVVYRLTARGNRYAGGATLRQGAGWLLLDIETRRITSILRWNDGTATAESWPETGAWYTSAISAASDVWFMSMSHDDGDAWGYAQLHGQVHPARVHLGGRAWGDVAASLTGVVREGERVQSGAYAALSTTARIDIAATRSANEANHDYAALVADYAARVGAIWLPATPLAPTSPDTSGPVMLYTFSEHGLLAGGGALSRPEAGGFLLYDTGSGAVRVIRAWQEGQLPWYRLEVWPTPVDYALIMGTTAHRFVGGGATTGNDHDFWMAHGMAQVLNVGASVPLTAPLQLHGERWSHRLATETTGRYSQGSFTGTAHGATIAINRLGLDIDSAAEYVIVNLVPDRYQPAL